MIKEYNIQCKKCGEIIQIAHITPDDNLKFDVDGDKANLIIDEYGNIPIHNDTDEILNEVMEEIEDGKKSKNHIVLEEKIKTHFKNDFIEIQNKSIEFSKKYNRQPNALFINSKYVKQFYSHIEKYVFDEYLSVLNNKQFCGLKLRIAELPYDGRVMVKFSVGLVEEMI